MDGKSAQHAQSMYRHVHSMCKLTCPEMVWRVWMMVLDEEAAHAAAGAASPCDIMPAHDLLCVLLSHPSYIWMLRCN